MNKGARYKVIQIGKSASLPDGATIATFDDERRAMMFCNGLNKVMLNEGVPDGASEVCFGYCVYDVRDGAWIDY